MKRGISKKIGIIGGGQLGKMMIAEAKRMGFYVITLDPEPDCPSHSVSDEHIISNYDDENGIKMLCEKADVITYEFEHINKSSLDLLATMDIKVYPSIKSLLLIQNKFTQKAELRKNNIPVADFCKVNSISDIVAAGRDYGFPILLKSCRGGYDGKGNCVVNCVEAAEAAFTSLSGELMAEKFVPFVMEISALACRGVNGDIAVFPIAQNLHIENILIETKAPADISNDTAKNAVALTRRVMEVFEGVGMFCVEMFVLEDGGVYVNEVAPRPHNSGHYTIEGCVTSQFEQHIRAITELPLGDPSLIMPSAMRNLLGESGHFGKTSVCGAEKALAISGVRLHIYGKSETRPKRKMGHVTATAETIELAAKNAEEAWEYLKIESQ